MDHAATTDSRSGLECRSLAHYRATSDGRWFLLEWADMTVLDVGDGRMIECEYFPAWLVGTRPYVEELRHNKGNEATFGIWHVAGASDSAVLKIFRAPTGNWTAYWPTSDEPTHWNYWRREPLAYTSGLVSAFAEAGVVPPALLACVDRPDGMIEVWLEYVAGADGFSWSPDRIGRLARELGAGQARWTGRHEPTPWLSRRWLAQYMAGGPSRGVAIRDEDWDNPAVAAWPVGVRRELRRLWHDRGRALAMAEAAERTLCHLDIWPANSIDQGGRSVQLDWAFAGAGAVGEDIGSLVLHCFTDGLMPAELLPEVAERCIDGYLEGLADGGWKGAADDVRTTIAASGIAKYSWFGPNLIGRATRGNEIASNYSRDSSGSSAMERAAPVAALIAQWSAAVLG